MKKDDTVKSLIADGNAALNAQKFGDAVNIFQQAKKLAPDNLAVMTGLTKAEQARDRLLAADRRQAEEIARTQGFARLVKSGRDNLAAKHFEAAVANLSEAVKLNPTDASVQSDLKKAIAGRDAAFTDAKAQAAAKLRADQYQKLLTEGHVALDSKRFGDAIKSFTDAQKLLPGDLASKNLLLEAQSAKKAADDAVAAAAKQRADDLRKAGDVQKTLTAGRAALAAKDFAKAKKLFEDAKAINPSDAEVLRALRDVAQAEASALAEAAAQKQRAAQFQTALSAGRDALNAKKYSEALKSLSTAATLMPGNKEAQDLFRRAQAEAKQAADAAAADKTRLANYQSAMSLGQKALQAKQFGDAIKSFQQALDLMPNDADAQRLMKLARDSQAAAARSAEDFQKAMVNGQAAMAKGNFADAIKAFTAAKNLNPMDAAAQKLLAQAQKALADANQAALNMANYQKAMTAGQTAMTAKNYGLAVASFKDALRWSPNDQRAQTQLQNAERALADSQKTKPDPAKAFTDAMARGAAAEKDKRYSDALKAYQEAVKLRPNDANAQAGLKQNQYAVHLVQGQQYLDNAMWMSAQTEFEAALRLFPNADQAKKLLQKAKSKMK
ncbi:MAG: tetratricopeptide repeat protein [Planctomycetes bacterium]|nr:tetratricopeptide repeat protein [Planctomycetota bacterium]